MDSIGQERVQRERRPFVLVPVPSPGHFLSTPCGSSPSRPCIPELHPFALHELTPGAYRDILFLSTSERAFFRFWHHHCSPRIVVDQGGMPTGCPRGVRTGDATVCATRSRGPRRPGSARPGSVRAQGGSLPPPGHSYRPLLELSAWRARMAARSMGPLRPGGSAPHASPA